MTSLTPRDTADLKREIASSMHCALPGTVESFDPETQTVSVQPALKRGLFSLPLIRDVPVFFPGSKDQAVTWPVSAGDECLLIFADSDIDSWFDSGEAEEPFSARQHSLPDAFAFVGFRSRPNALENLSESASFFGVNPAASGHVHSAADITSGTLPLARGGAGQTATGATTTIASIATAASGCEITTAQYAYWGKVAMVRLVIKKSAAVSSGTTTLCTMVSGKRPKYNASATWAWNKTAQILSSGNVQVNGAISANASMTIYSTFILA